MKVFVEDYTQLPEKVLIQNQHGKTVETGRCTICNKIGLIENREGKVSYFHRLGYEFIPSEQFPAIRDETCNLPSTSGKTKA